MLKKYNTRNLTEGWNDIESESGRKERVFFIQNPALGLWAVKNRLAGNSGPHSMKDSDVIVSLSDQSANTSSDVGGWAKPPDITT